MSKREKELVDDDWLSINVFRERESIRGQFNGHYLWELYFRKKEREREFFDGEIERWFCF